MKTIVSIIALVALTIPCAGQAPITNALPGRTIVKMLPDHGRPKVYALNRGNGSTPGTVLALNPTNGVVLGELSVNVRPTDMAITPTGEAMYVIHAGSRTISKVDLNTFAVLADKTIATPSSYSLDNPLYIVAGQGERLYYTDGAWGPQIYFFDFSAGTNLLVLNTGGNSSHGAGGMTLNRGGTNLYIWQQYGWSAGSINSWVTRFAVQPDASLVSVEDSFTSARRDPLDTPLFLDAAERWVFNKRQMFLATNVTVLVNQFPNNLYGISLDGSIAFGPTEVFNTANGSTLTNLPFSTTVMTLSGDQKKLFRHHAAASSVVIYDMASLAPVSGPELMPTPADGAVVSLPVTNLQWTVSPLALAYDVYFGTNQAQVASATTASPQYLGRRTAPPQPLAESLAPGATYYWRVDVAGFNVTNSGPVWSFTTSTLAVEPQQIVASAIAGYNPASLTLNLSGGVAWTASVTGGNWLALGAANGTAPGTLTVQLQTAALAAGTYTNQIAFQVGGSTLMVPVSLTVRPLNIIKMAADRNRPYIYALQPPPHTGQNGLLLFINTQTGNIDKTLNIGVNPVDLSVNDQEGRLYIASWSQETWTYVVDLNTQTLLPSLNLGTDVFKLNAGRAGRIVIEGQNQWVYMSLINTANGATLSSSFVREGDGEFDPTGRYYYHVDNNISSAGISKHDTISNSFIQVAGSGNRGSYYGSRNLVMSADGSRLVWTRMIFDANLVSYDLLPSEVYSLSTNGRMAFGATEAYDTQTRQLIHTLPVSSSVSVVDGQNQFYWYFANGTLNRIPLSAIMAPKITQQPAANTAVLAGSPVYLTVAGIGLAPLTYQWALGGTNVPAATNYFLSLPALQPGQDGAYRVTIANAAGSVTSAVAQVTLLTAPAIVTQPVPTNVLAGQSFSLTVTATGSSPLNYRWLLDNSTVAGATSPTLAVTNAQAANQGVYRVIVTNSVGAATSAPVLVRVYPSAPAIITPPMSISVHASSNAAFSVQAQGTQPLGYQWLFNGNAIPGATASAYSLTAVQAANSGAYQVVVSNTVGRATSSIATLTVLPLAPYFTLQPTGAAVSAGTGCTFTGQANGSQPIAYQWQRNGTNLSGATGTSLVLTNLTVNDSGNYTLLASNVAGFSTSAVAALTVYQNATLLAALSNQVVEIGGTVTLSVDALGTQPLGYNWQFNGTGLPATNATLMLTNIQFSQAGFYRVLVTNQYGSVASTSRVSVLERPSAVLAWGDNIGGQCDVPIGVRDAVAVAGGDFHSLALRRNGTLLGWGYNGDGQTNVPTNVLRFVAIAAGGAHNLAVTERGSVVAWGRNQAGQANVPAAANNNVLAIAAGDEHSLALLSAGTVVAWGNNSLGQTSVPQGLTGVRAIAAGRKHSLALRTNGVVVGWGYGTFGQTQIPVSLTDAVAIAAGYLHSVALRSNGTVVCWGDNTYGQTNVPSGLTNVIAVVAGDFHTYARRVDGSVVGWGDGWYDQLNIPVGATNALTIASGYYHGLALVTPLPQLWTLPLTGGLAIHWEGGGVLQWAPTPTGPFEDMPGSSGGYTNWDFTAPAKFFRVRR